ncbi:MAG TPA: LapA family protein [Gaiellaceae bacterium]
MTATREGDGVHVDTQAREPQPRSEPVEARGDRLRRHAHRTRLYASALSLVALLVVLIALAVGNTRQVRLNWVVGSSHASLVWIILATAVLGWLLGIVTSVVFRLRTRRRRTSADRAGGGDAP